MHGDRLSHSQAGTARQAIPSNEFLAGLLAVLPDLRRRARQLTYSHSDAEDLTQETCRRALESHSQFTPGTRIHAWLWCILRNLNHDRQRRTSREVELTDDLGTVSDVRELARWRQASDADLEGALQKLPAMYAEIYALRVVHKLSYCQIGLRLGVASGTVATRLRRTHLRLRSLLVPSAVS